MSWSIWLQVIFFIVLGFPNKYYGNNSIPEVGGYLGIFLGISLFDLRILGSVVTEKYISAKVEDTKNGIAVMEGVKDGWVK